MRWQWFALVLALGLGACGGEADDSASDPAQVRAAREALTASCQAKEGETESSCACYIERVTAALTPKQVQVLAKGDAAPPEEQGDLARADNYAAVVTAQAACLING